MEDSGRTVLPVEGDATPHVSEAQSFSVKKVNDKSVKFLNGAPQTKENDFHAVGSIARLPGGKEETGPLGPASFLATLQDSDIVTWTKETLKEKDGTTTDVYYPKVRKGSELMTPGGSPTFAGVRSNVLSKKLDFLSLMLALFLRNGFAAAHLDPVLHGEGSVGRAKVDDRRHRCDRGCFTC